MRWLIVMPYARPGAMGIDFAEELRSLGHVVETFAYRRDNVLYKNKPTKTAYQRALNRRLERLCADQRPDVVLVVKGGPIAPDVVRRMKTATSALAGPAANAAARSSGRPPCAPTPGRRSTARGSRPRMVSSTRSG